MGLQKQQPIKIKLDTFEGPLDLLLHLIRVSEIDVFDIPIVSITDQYIEYIDMLKEIDIDVGSEFMLMAATLIHIKTKMMLPQREGEEDPRAELVERLLEHQQYKAAAQVLGKHEERELKVWQSPKNLTRRFLDVEEELVEADIFQLIAAFQRVMKSIGEDYMMEIEHQHYSISEKIQMIEGTFRAKPRLMFSEIVEHMVSKREIIVTFLAILELIRRKTVTFTQTKSFGEIVLVATDSSQGVISIQ